MVTFLIAPDPSGFVNPSENFNYRKEEVEKENIPHSNANAITRIAASLIPLSATCAASKTKEAITKSFSFGGSVQQGTLIGQGKYHRVFGFSQSVNVRLNGQVVNGSNIVVRQIFSCMNALTLNRVREEDRVGYEMLLENQVPLPHCYARSEDTALLERIPHRVSCQGWQGIATAKELYEHFRKNESDHRLLFFVKKWLQKSANEGKEFINDFFPRNVMRRENGSYCSVDFSPPTQCREEWQENLFSYLKAWSNGSPAVWNYLIDNFTPTVKARMEVLLVDRH